MTVLTILEVPDAGLRAVAAPVAEIDDSIRATLADMFETMYAAPGIGLAAIQVGIEKRLVVIDLQEPEEEGGEPVRKPIAFVNPELFWVSDEMAVYNEGCLSIPEQYADRAPRAVPGMYRRDARRRGRNGWPMATCIQHEIDHLNGVVHDHISKLRHADEEAG